MKQFCLFFVLAVALIISTQSVGLAGDDPIPGVTYNPLGTACGVPAGDYGFFRTMDWYWAVYSNGRAILKCTAQLAPEQIPPVETLILEDLGLCGTPEGTTEDAFTKIFEDGTVHLICRIRLMP